MSHHHQRSMHSSSSSTKDENLDFVYLNNPPTGVGSDSTTSSSNSFYNYSAESASFHHHHHHQYGADHQAALSSNAFSHFANYQQPHFQTGMVVGKPDHHYSSVPHNVFSGDAYDPAVSNKGYSAARTFSGNDLLADNSNGRNLRRLNSDVSSAFEFGTYNPFQGSPLEITNLTRLESRSNSLISEEQAAPIQQQVVQPVHNEPFYETVELHMEDSPSETGQNASGSSSKRSYKDVLTISQNRSESPNNNASSSSPVETVAHTAVTNNSRSSKVDNEQTRKETYKDKLLSSSSSNKIASSQPASSSPSVSSPAQPTKQQTQSTSLNNHRSQINTNPKKPLKINNNLAAGKGNVKAGEKNWTSGHNESFRSVRSQTDLGGGIGNKKSKSGGGNRTASLSDNPSFEHLPVSDEEDDDDRVGVSPVEVRKELKRSDRKGNKSRTESNNKENERSINRGRHKTKHTQQSRSAALARAYFPKVARLCGWFFMWLYNLCADVLQMSCNLSWQGLQSFQTVCWEKSYLVTDWIKLQTRSGRLYVTTHWLPSVREFFRFFRRSSAAEEAGTSSSGGLNANIPLPATGEEAMHRLLACKGRDPYSILGVRRDCSDEEIRRYYKRQAVLVHPDKNRQRGAEEAFKILAHAFELIGAPERRSHYDQLVAEADEMESAWAELNELLAKLHAKMDEAANTIRCTNCSKRHRRLKTDRPCYAARYCQDCKIHHSAREGDLWAESRLMGFRSNYYACMEGAVYDITEWANCQAGHLRHLQSNSHRVQYRIVPGQAGGQQPSHGGRKSS